MEVIRQRAGAEDDGEDEDVNDGESGGGIVTQEQNRSDVEVIRGEMDGHDEDVEVVDADVVDADVRLRFRLYDHIKASFIHLFGFEPCDPFLGYKLSYMILLIE
ncbi:unnamed protein product [Cochlearia groenlandica]